MAARSVGNTGGFNLQWLSETSQIIGPPVFGIVLGHPAKQTVFSDPSERRFSGCGLDFCLSFRSQHHFFDVLVVLVIAMDGVTHLCGTKVQVSNEKLFHG
jgi:hypothetical protein